MNKTKIVCTLGPATSKKETLKCMMQKGMNVVRFNLSHLDREECRETIKVIHELEKELNTTIGILFDTKGPEIRLGDFVEPEIYLKKNSNVRIMMNEILGNDRYFSVNYPGLIDDVEVGDTILLNDGMVNLTVTGKELDAINCVVNNDGMIMKNKGVNVPNVKLNLPFLNDRDVDDIKFASEMNGDFLAASFVSCADDVLDISDLLISLNNDHMKIISKIENKNGLNEIENIISVSDGIMVARGDLGVEIPLEEVPVAQKKIINLCHNQGKISIVATEMLSSMERNSRPTRAEVSDVANAVLDGTAAVMLSGETAVGDYPVQVVDTMRKIVEATEAKSNYNDYLSQEIKEENKNITDGIAFSVVSNANLLNTKLIIASTMSGYTARKISRLRPVCPILATSPNDKTVRSLTLNWGVYPVLTKEVHSLDEMIQTGISLAKEKFPLKRRDVVIVSAGFPLNTEKKTNFLKVEEID